MTSKTKALPEILTKNAIAMAARADAIDWEKTAKEYVIDSVEMAEVAAADLVEIKAKAKELEELRTTLKKPSLEEGKAIDGHFREPAKFLKNAEAVLKGSILSFQQAEQKRIEAINQARIAKAEEEQAKAEAEHQERVKEAEASGDQEKLEEVLEQSTYVAPAVYEEAPKLAGISTRSNWKARVDDKLALIKAVAEGKVDIEAIDINMPYLNGIARSLKGQMNVPGVTAFDDAGLSVRT